MILVCGCAADLGIVTSGTCGDGMLDLGEQCDDGNLTPGDGCDEKCQLQNICGNGLVESIGESPEQCDDGNDIPTDGCSECKLDCGNGRLEVKDKYVEACDDNNHLSGDGCSSSCQVEDGYYCTVVPSPSFGEMTACYPVVCGDGLIVPPEACDDDNQLPNDGCFGCALELGWECTFWGEPVFTSETSKCFPDSCNDYIQNNDETGIDCGGSCGLCLGSACMSSKDCALSVLCVGIDPMTGLGSCGP
jgi:cysteine-rich repeat protein